MPQAYQSITGGWLQLGEQRNADGTLSAPVQTLDLINTWQFDGQAAHIKVDAVNSKTEKPVKRAFNVFDPIK